MENYFITREQRAYNGERIVSSINGAGKTEQPHEKDHQTTMLSTKINPKRIKDSNVRTEP